MWFTRAQASAANDPPLIARIAFEIASLHFVASQLGALSAVIAWAERMLGDQARSMADLSHARALWSELANDIPNAQLAYRSAIQTGDALTPLTRVLAMRNVATLLNHTLPREAVGFCELGLSQVDAGELDPRYRARLLTILSYSSICAGEVVTAEKHARAAAEVARSSGNHDIVPSALFNAAIALELQGRHDQALCELRRVEAEAREISAPLAAWATLRQAWIHVLTGDLPRARRIGEDLLRIGAADLAPALDLLSGLIALHEGGFAVARVRLAEAICHYSQRGDDLTTFVLRLWSARLEQLAGMERAARRDLVQGIELARTRRFKVSPNWWSDDLVATALECGDSSVRDYAGALHRTGANLRPPATASVVLGRDGTITTATGPLLPSTWQQGKTGARVLRRYFRVLARRHPAGISRDDLADELWPESDGDRAVRNLYAATHDLRRVLSTIPGVALSVDDRVYRLRCADYVRVLGAEDSEVDSA